MLTEYINAAMANATYELLDDGTFCGEVPGLRGVLANSSTREACEVELRSVVDEWLASHLIHQDAVPDIGGERIDVKLILSDEETDPYASDQADIEA